MTKLPKSRVAPRQTLAAMLVGLTLFALATAALAGRAFAETRTLETTIDGQITDAASLAPKGDQIELSLEDAVAAALEHNLGLRIERYQRSRSILGIEQSRGIYDFNLGATLSTSASTSQPTSALVDTTGAFTRDRDIANFSLARLTPFGGTGTLSFDNSRIETNDRTDTFNPNFSADLGFDFVQPLLRNFGRLATERNLIIARTNSAISRETFETQVASTIQQVSDRYWDLVEAREQLRVSEESLALAKQLHEMNRIQVEVGTLAPLEMIQSEAGVASREEEIIRGRARVQDSEDLLRQLINLEQGELWDVPILPATSPEIAYREIDLGKSITTAFTERPELRSRRLENERLSVEARYFKNQKRPELNLTAGYGFNGVGGDVRDRTMVGEDGLPVVIFPGGYGDALDQLADRDSKNWIVMLALRYPLENRAAKAQSAIADLALEQGAVELRQLEQSILTEVRRAERSVRTAAQSIESAKVASRLQQKNLEAEQKRYENGLSTSFQVLQIQEDLALARSREVSAVADYRRALTAYHRAVGQLLDETGVELAADEP